MSELRCICCDRAMKNIMGDEGHQVLMDKIDGLEADLDSAVEVAWSRGAHEWVRLNYPKHYERLTSGGDADDRL